MRIVVSWISVLIVGAAAAQAPPVTYVASVKLNRDVEPRGFSEYQGGRLTATAVTMAALLRIAYRVQGYQIVGAPAWTAVKHYDLAAKAEGTPPPAQPALLKALLADRFKLAAHTETREMPVFDLILARSAGRLGKNLAASAFDCAAYLAGPHDLPQPGKTPVCGMRVNLGAMTGKAVSLAQFAASLSGMAGRLIIDKTGLPGGYDVELTWTPDPGAPAIAFNSTPDVTASAQDLSIFAALQEQLGLKLVPARGPVQVLVIDHVEEPAEN